MGTHSGACNKITRANAPVIQLICTRTLTHVLSRNKTQVQMFYLLIV